MYFTYQFITIIFISLCVHSLMRPLSVYKQTAVAIAAGYVNNVATFT